MMDARTRLRRTCRSESVDRFCIMNMGHWPETLAAWRAQGLQPAEEGSVHGNDPAAGMGLVLGSAYTSPFWPRFERTTIDETDEYIVELDEHGRVKKWQKNGGRPELAQWLRFPVQTPADWETVKWRMDPANESRFAELEDTAKRCGGFDNRDFPVGQHTCGPYRMLWLAFGDEGIAYALADYPDLVHEILRTWLRLMKTSMERILSVIDLDQVWMLEDVCYRGGMMISPAQFRRFILPYYQDLTEYLHRFPSVVCIGVDSDGKVDELIPLLLEGGVNAITPCEVQAGNSVAALRKKYEQRLVMRGGIDKREIARGRAAIDAELQRVLPTFAETGGYLVCLDHQAHPDISLADYRYYVERATSWPMRDTP